MCPLGHRPPLARGSDGPGLCPRTINSNVAEVNGLLDFLGHRELQLPGQLDVGGDDQPELTRTEYLRLLSAARLLERERTYLLVKLFATTGIGVQDVPLVTVEAVRDGSVPRPMSAFPPPWRAELLDYCGRMGLTSGPVFVTRTGRTLCRTAILTPFADSAGTPASRRRNAAPGACTGSGCPPRRTSHSRSAPWWSSSTSTCSSRSSAPSAGNQPNYESLIRGG